MEDKCSAKVMAKKEAKRLASLIFSCYALLSTVRHLKILAFYNILHVYGSLYSENKVTK